MGRTQYLGLSDSPSYSSDGAEIQEPLIFRKVVEVQQDDSVSNGACHQG